MRDDGGVGGPPISLITSSDWLFGRSAAVNTPVSSSVPHRAVAVVGLLLHCTIPSCDDGTGTRARARAYINAQNALIVNGFVSRQHRKLSLL